MFTYIKLQNFKCFDEISVDLTDKRNNPKKLIILYGGNASGKSNFLSVFTFLEKTLMSMMIRDLISSILTNENSTQEVIEKIKTAHSHYKIEEIISQYKMIGSANEPMSVEVGFQIEGQPGFYYIETNDSCITKEKLEFIIEKNRGTYIDFDTEKQQINKKQFLATDAFNEIKNSCEKFWGQHSFLSILQFEIKDKIPSFFKDNVSDSLKKVLKFFLKIRTLNCSFDNLNTSYRLQRFNINRVDRGIISEDKEEKLEMIEQCLNETLPKLFKNIKQVFYKKEHNEDSIRYTLYLQTLIAGKIRNIEITQESSGVKKFLDLLPYWINLSKGHTIVVDEFDNGLHDIFINSIIESINQTVLSQVIVTTHNTFIMESNIPKDYFYTISDSDNGKREIKHITYYDPKIGQSTNIRKQYLANKYKGLPEVNPINFTELFKCFSD